MGGYRGTLSCTYQLIDTAMVCSIFSASASLLKTYIAMNRKLPFTVSADIPNESERNERTCLLGGKDVVGGESYRVQYARDHSHLCGIRLVMVLYE